MNLIPRNQLADFDSLFDDFFTGFPMLVGKSDLSRSLGGMRVDIHETDTDFEITADLPGVRKKDISVSLDNGILTITASRESEKEEKKKGRVIRRERTSGTITRSFSVRDGVRQEDIKASFSDGVLSLNIPKIKKSAGEDKPRNISID